MTNTQQTYIAHWDIHTLDTQVLETDKAQTTASVIHWRKPDGNFTDVKANNWWALKVESEVVNASGTIINPATEEKQDTNIAILEELRTLNTSIYELSREQARFASLRPSELPYAKTNADALRVNIDWWNSEVLAIRFGSNNASPSMYSTWAWSAFDAREFTKLQYWIIAELRIGKWTIS